MEMEVRVSREAPSLRWASQRAAGQAEAMREYLAWEVDLLQRIERDGSCSFRLLHG
jgi:hypothetical protein